MRERGDEKEAHKQLSDKLASVSVCEWKYKYSFYESVGQGNE